MRLTQETLNTLAEAVEELDALQRNYGVKVETATITLDDDGERTFAVKRQLSQLVVEVN